MLVAQRLDSVFFPQFAGLPANLASMVGLQFGMKQALANGVIRIIDVDAQPAELLLHCRISNWRPVACSNSATPWFPVFAQPPENVEPAILMKEAPKHQGVANVTLGG
jgi:hypothetical protein